MNKWLEKYSNGDIVQQNYNNTSVSLPEGFVGMGYNTKGRNYSPAWGGQFQDGGNLTFLEPTSRKLPKGYVIPYNTPSTELASSIGGENGEPAYLIPTFKYGKPLKDPVGEFRKTGEHLGGPFKTWQEAEEWEKTIRHPYVEKGQSIPTPLKRWGKDFAMGGSIPGSVGFTYARTNSPAPSEGPYAKKTMPSAQDGGWLNKYEVPKNQNAEYKLPSITKPREASESTSRVFYDPYNKKMVNTATTGQTKENLAASTRAMGKTRKRDIEEEKQRVAERKSAVATKDKGTDFTLPTGETKKFEDMDAREKMYVSGKALEQRGRFNENEESFFDEWVNPLNFIGGMAGDLATAPYVAKQTNSNLPYAGAILPPLLMGALGMDPLSSTINVGKKIGNKVGQSMESGLLSKAYKINPYAFKPNPEAYYRMVGKKGIKDATESGVIRANQKIPLADNGEPFGGMTTPEFDVPYFSKSRPFDGRNYNKTSYYGSYEGPGMIEVKNTGNFKSLSPRADYIGLPKSTIKTSDDAVKLYKQDWLKGYKEVPRKEEGGVIKDNMGYWNPENHGKVVEIDSPYITMEGVDQPLIGISDEGDQKYMLPGKNYKFKGKKVREYPVAKNGVRQEQKGLQNLENLTNFTNYSKPTNWLNKYN